MLNMVNDEKPIPEEWTKDRRPTERLRLRRDSLTGVILEQLWTSPFVGVEDMWLPVPFVANSVIEPTSRKA